MIRRSRASSSTCSAASPPATPWPTASSRRCTFSVTRPTSRWSSASTATTSTRAVAFLPRRTTRWSRRSGRWTKPPTSRPPKPLKPRKPERTDMAIFLTKDNKVIVQGITGGEATTHTARMLKAGTQIVGGVNARKAGTTVSHKDVNDNDIELPVLGTVVEAIEKTGADVSIIFVPPKFAKDAIIEAIDAEIPLLVVITEGIPVQDSAYAWAYNVEKGNKTRIICPNYPGIITPGQSLVGITPANISGPGPIGLVSKSGTLTYQMMFELRDFGFTTSIGIGGDPVIGTTHIDAIEAFEKDPDTKVIVMIGEIGGDAEERAADYIKANVSKPVVGYVAGFTAPEGKTMGHAGAIVSGSSGTAQAKKEALEAAGVKVGKTPSETARLAREILQSL